MAKIFYWLKKEVPRWLRYLYFLRFSIILWCFPLLLLWANQPQYARSLVSGILTPVHTVQYVCVSFFLVTGSCVALILARIVVINGAERFGSCPPRCLTWLFDNDEGKHEWIAPIVSQINNLAMFWYFIWNGKKEEVPWPQVALGIVVGFVLGLFFWYALTAFYYLTYDPATGAHPKKRFGKMAAHTLLLPRRSLALGTNDKRRRFGDVLEDATTPVHLIWLKCIFPVAGYRWKPKGPLYEAHYFSILATLGFYALYWALWPLTAPVPVPALSTVSLILYCLVGVAVYAVVLSAKPKNPKDRKKLWGWKAILALPVFLFAFSIPWLYFHYDAERFPILALVLILVISSSWTLGAVGFFADRFRIPVLTTIVIFLLVIPRLAHWDKGNEEHYLSTSWAQAPAALPTPADILAHKLAANRLPGKTDEPLIVVTSTGGGIHAAAWTAAVLRHLQTEFEKSPAPTSFQDHLLLVSTVSGGSAGLYTYLRELDPKTNGGKADWDRMIVSAQCSSLEAIGWGLVYHDIPKALVPRILQHFVPDLYSPSPGAGNLDDSPLGKDRTWALRKAFARNLEDPFCEQPQGSNGTIPLAEVNAAKDRDRISEQELTLAGFNALENSIPAFTMNTTSVEYGSRFLLSNYTIPGNLPGLQDDYRARSFLDTYPGSSNSPADLPLATAAQMSATFPFVSSAARVPQALENTPIGDPQSMHFVDGGYYDNDGTASAIEFLKYALNSPPPTQCESEKPAAKSAGNGAANKPGECPVRILLIEIRNSGDVSPNSPVLGGGTNPWNLGDQLTAPLNAFWQAGHESVTGRSRVALSLLEASLAHKVQIRHIVIPDDYAVDKTTTDALSWALTPRQQGEVWGSAQKIEPCYAEVKDWFFKDRADWTTELPSPEKQCVP